MYGHFLFETVYASKQRSPVVALGADTSDWWPHFSGQLRREELALRHFMWAVFLTEAKDEEATWLCRLLKPWPLVFRAKLLYILYGPHCERESAFPSGSSVESNAFFNDGKNPVRHCPKKKVRTVSGTVSYAAELVFDSQ